MVSYKPCNIPVKITMLIAFISSFMSHQITIHVTSHHNHDFSWMFPGNWYREISEVGSEAVGVASSIAKWGDPRDPGVRVSSDICGCPKMQGTMGVLHLFQNGWLIQVYDGKSIYKLMI